MNWLYRVLIFGAISFSSCKKDNNDSPVKPLDFGPVQVSLNGVHYTKPEYDVNRKPRLVFKFTQPVLKESVASAISFKDAASQAIPFTTALQNADSVIVVEPSANLDYYKRYQVTVSALLKSASNGRLLSNVSASFVTSIDSSRKFPLISEEALLDSVQKRTFKYFWDLAHPVSGMIRERNTDANTYTSGGTGFGIMAIVAAIHRGFITRNQGLQRLETMVSFLKNTVDTYHGAFPHWFNGQTGKTIPFSANDNGADIVETSFLVQGLLTARQYFDGVGAAEVQLREDINTIVDRVEWDWFRKNNEDVLYWHWSPNPANGWVMNMQVKGWNECLITYILAASSKTHTIPREVYDIGWASSGGIKNGKTYYNYTLPLGPELGGPLFFSHYSFLGVNPNGLTDTYASYTTQARNHTLINYNYCVANPKNYYGYSDSVWGLTASDIQNGYQASSPTNDLGYIAPTAALSSFPYAPEQSMKALKFYYYVLGDKIWKEYGFVDAFSLHHEWFANTYLAIDQGPIIVMIENYRSGLLWDLLMSCPEIKAGLIKLGFDSPHL